MKALSIRQPWAWLIANGHKDIENRSWYTHFRGRYLIHAAKGMTRLEYYRCQYFCDLYAPEKILLPPFKDLDRGGIVGSAILASCLIEKDPSMWHTHGSFGFKVLDPIQVEFFPCRGSLSFFETNLDLAYDNGVWKCIPSHASHPCESVSIRG